MTSRRKLLARNKAAEVVGSLVPSASMGGSLGRQFSEAELVNLTVVPVVAINGRNRLAISFRVVHQTDHAQRSRCPIAFQTGAAMSP